MYAAFYRSSGDNVTREGEYYVGDVKGLVAMAKEGMVFVGAGAHSNNISIKTVEAVPNGAVIARLAVFRLEQGDSDDALALTPLYLKESTARAFLGRYSGKAQVTG